MAPGSEFRYRAEPIRCHGCATQARASDAYQAAGGDTAGLAFAVIPKESQ